MTDSFDSQEGHLSNDFGPFDSSTFENDIQLFGNQDTTDVTTVSPQDILMDASHLSGPPSGDMYTNLSTPDSQNWGSPFTPAGYGYIGTDNTLISNLDDEIDPESSSWSNLFAEADTVPIPSIEQESPAPMSRTTSSSHRAFSTSVGIVKSSRRAAKPLPALNPDAVEDPKDKKRMKNTEAARKSRAKKETERNELVAEITRLRLALESSERDVAHWKGIAAVFQSQQTGAQVNFPERG